ncbi:MAG: VOC family protein, partial [Gemmatimonadota bacterium]
MAYAKHKQKGIHHVCLRVPDLVRTRDFYLKALDAELVAEWGTPGEENHAFILDLGTGDYLEIFGSGKVFDVGSWQHLAVWTDDIEAAVRRALEAGAEPVSPPRDA